MRELLGVLGSLRAFLPWCQDALVFCQTNCQNLIPISQRGSRCVVLNTVSKQLFGFVWNTKSPYMFTRFLENLMRMLMMFLNSSMDPIGVFIRVFSLPSTVDGDLTRWTSLHRQRMLSVRDSSPSFGAQESVVSMPSVTTGARKIDASTPF